MTRFPARQPGFILVIVVIALIALSAMALLLTNSTSMDRAMLVKQSETDTLDYVTEAGLQHAKWQLSQNSSCTGFANLPVTIFGDNSYTATVTPVSASPVSLTAVGTLANGASRSLTRSNVKTYEPITIAVLQPDAATGKDTWLYKWKPDWNYGTSGELSVTNKFSDSLGSGLLQFDVSTIPAQAEIISATLELRQNFGGAQGGNVAIHRVTTAWDEGSKSGQPGASNWNEKSTGMAWASTGGDYTSSASATTVIASGTVGWFSWNITDLVSDWTSGTLTNDGFAMVPATPSTDLYFNSSDHVTSSYHPKLTITYACECGVGGTATVDVLQPDAAVGKDTSLHGGGQSSNNYGQATPVWIDNQVPHRSLFEFDLSYLPAGVVVTDAKLNLYVNGIDAVTTADVGVYRITQPWVEGTGENSGLSPADGADFGTHDGTNPWSTPGGDYDPASGETISVSTTAAQWYQWDVTSMVGDWVGGVQPNHGFLLRGDAGYLEKMNVYSSDVGDATKRPKLTVSYNCPCGVDCSGGGSGGGGTVYLDQFNSFTCDFSVDYAGSDGTLDWSAQPWTEVADIDNSCTSAGKLLDDLGSTVARIAEADKGFMRPVDLSAFSTAWLHFDYRLESLDSSTDMLSVSVSGDGGTNWIEVAQFTGPADDAAYLRADIDISPHAGADTVIRFMSVNTSATELIHFDNVQIDDAPPVPGPIAHWKLDDGVGLTAIDSEGGHDGSLNGPPAWTTGNIDGALDFDGVDDYVDVGSFDVTGTGITMMGWFNAEVLGTEDGRIISKANGVNEADAWWQLSTTDVGASRFLRMRIKAGGTTTTLADASVNLSTSQWYFAVATYDNASGEMKLYLDGTELASNIHDVGGALDTDATVPVAIGANGTAERYFDGILDDVRVYDYAIDATEVSNLYSANPPPAPPGYNETYATWSATANDTWQVVDLAPFGVPAGAVVEVAVVNSRDNFQYWGGVRSVGSALDRRLQLHEAESGGTDVMVMHVQADAASQIEHYSDTADISFILLGWWGSSTFEERWDPFPADVEGAWHSKPLQGFGVSSGSVAEVVIRNVTQGFEIRGGVREAGSTLSRIIEIHEAEGGGDDTATMFVNTSTDASASVEVYTDDTGLKYILAGFWSTPPGTYTESGGAFGQVSSPASWETIDLTSFGVPANAVAQFMLANERVSEENLLGVRATDSAINNRLLNLQEAEAGGSDLGSMHVNVDTSSQVQWTAEYGATGAKFYPVGWWVLTP